MTPYTWQTFVNGASSAREGQMERFFFAKKAFHIQIVSEEANNPPKNRQEPSKKGSFSQDSQPLAQNSRNEGSLKSGIPETRDHSIRWPADGAACSCVKSD